MTSYSWNGMLIMASWGLPLTIFWDSNRKVAGFPKPTGPPDLVYLLILLEATMFRYTRWSFWFKTAWLLDEFRYEEMCFKSLRLPPEKNSYISVLFKCRLFVQLVGNSFILFGMFSCFEVMPCVCYCSLYELKLLGESGYIQIFVVFPTGNKTYVHSLHSCIAGHWFSFGELYLLDYTYLSVFLISLPRILGLKKVQKSSEISIVQQVKTAFAMYAIEFHWPHGTIYQNNQLREEIL